MQKRQVFYKGTKAELLELRHDSLSRPILFDPKTGEFEAVRQDYDRFGHLSKWEWGSVSETYDYDKSGRLSTVRSASSGGAGAENESPEASMCFICRATRRER